MRRGLLAFVLLALTSTGCFYSDVRVPLDDDVEKTELGDKVGRAKLTSILWLVAWGDDGVAAAADDGGIKVIQHLDREYKVILWGLYFRRTTIAYGD